MGNVISAANPPEILPVENYVSDLAVGDRCVESLGSTRFMKVAKARCSDGLNVFKVFLISDDLPDLEPYRREVMRIKEALQSANNCVPFEKIYLKPSPLRYVLLQRPFSKYTLLERMSTRPFIGDHEKAWYIFQLFKALSQCQSASVCHGDVKSQNVMVSSSGWVSLTDFASFKPTFLPHDNPSTFTFFFDTSRRQSCYIAPERFLTTTEYDRIEEQKGLFDGLTSSMDMFSAGCVVFEVLCDGRVPFNFSELCYYKQMSNPDAVAYLDKLLHPVPDHYRALLRLLLSREPALRPTAHQVLTGYSYLFPPLFDAFVYNYENALRPRSSTASMSVEDLATHTHTLAAEPDDVITKLRHDEDMVWSRLTADDKCRQSAVLFVSLVTSNIRALRAVTAKVDAMRLLVRLSSLAGPAVAVERVLPYLVHMLCESEPQVRAAAIYAITDAMHEISPVSYEHSLVFIDYLLPEMTALLEHRRGTCSYVLLALATNLGTIAETATRFLSVGRTLRDEAGVDDECSFAENERETPQKQSAEEKTLADSISNIFQVLSSHHDNTVRHCLVNSSGLEKLHAFFAKHSNGEMLLRHTITFLNIKSDWRLRAVFFDALPVCAGSRSVDVQSLLQQGLHDFEELVVVRAVHCIARLAERQLLDKHALFTLIADVVPFLAHPNEWIRVAVVEVLVVLDSKWSLADLHCRLLPLVAPHTKRQLMRLNSKVVLLACLRDPIPRELWRRITEMDTDRTRALIKNLEYVHHRPDAKLVQLQADNWWQRLCAAGLTDPGVSARLASFKQLLVKMAEFRRTSGMESELTKHHGLVDLSAHPRVRRQRHKYTDRGGQNGAKLSSADARPSMNREWNEIFSQPPANQGDRKWSEGGGGAGLNGASQNMRMMRSSVCDASLHELLAYKNELWAKKVRHSGLASESVVGSSMRDGLSGGERGRIRGQLLTHIHEHSRKITGLCLSTDGQRFASASADGSFKIWSTRQAMGECYGAVRSDHTHVYSRNHSVTGIAWVDSNCVAIAGSDRYLLLSDVVTEPTVATKLHFPESDGPVEQMAVNGQTAVVRTLHGAIYGLDFRVGKSEGPLGHHEVWRREIPGKQGLITSFCVDPHQAAWMVIASTNNYLQLWDLRYQLQVSDEKNWLLPGKDILPANVWPHPIEGADGPQVLVGLSRRGAVAIYDVHNANRNTVLWPSFSEPLDFSNGEDYVNTTTSVCVCAESGLVYSADSQGAIRSWNTTHPHKSQYISGCRLLPNSAYRVNYAMKLVDGGRTKVIHEQRVTNQMDSRVRPPCPADAKVTTFHRTSVSSLILLQSDLLASGAADGTIKIWK